MDAGGNKAGEWKRELNFEKLIELGVKGCKFDEQEKDRFVKSLAAELIMATAYISNCEQTDRIIVSHLITLAAAVRNPGIFKQNPGESTRERLATGCFFPGGNEQAIEAGTLLAELLSLNDHKKDVEADKKAGKYNPLINDLNYDAEKARILKEYDALPVFIKDRFIELYNRTLVTDFWF